MDPNEQTINFALIKLRKKNQLKFINVPMICKVEIKGNSFVLLEELFYRTSLPIELRLMHRINTV